MKNCFLPVENADSKILVLGSLPSEISLEKTEYYGNPRNAFWRIMFDIFGEEFSENYDKKCDLVLRHNIALWDVVKSAEREGSLDSDIKNYVVNDFEEFISSHKSLEKIILNGGKSYELFSRYCKNVKIQAVKLPSTSPANARLSYTEKLDAWRENIT